MSKHTPGPWEVHSGCLIRSCSGNICVPIAELRPPYRKQVGLVRGYSEECANAALIASAPDLLAERDRLREVNAEMLVALEAACEEIKYLRGWANNHGAMHDEERFTEGLVVIAKAKGGA